MRALVTDLATFEKVGGGDELVLTAVPAGPDPIEDRVACDTAATGWDVRVGIHAGPVVAGVVGAYDV